MFSQKSKAGFTIIELLVVIGIIAILATFMIVNFRSVIADARDARRLSDVDAIYKAMMLYDTDTTHFPLTDAQYHSDPTLGNSVISISTDGNNNSVLWQDLADVLSPYIRTLPRDPINTYGAFTRADTHIYLYRVFLDESGMPSTRWWDKKNCKIVADPVADGIEFRAFITAQFLESPQGNIEPLCETFPEGADTLYKYLRLLL